MSENILGNQVILVNKKNNPIGTCEKLRAHREGKLHRAFSLFIFNSRNELIIQKRARLKYHSGGLWSNTCCSHPSPGESMRSGIARRLSEEMGFICDVKELFSFIYRVELPEDSLYEHELDHVFMGRYDGAVAANPEEVNGVRCLEMERLMEEMKANPSLFTYWFRKSIERVGGYL